MLTDFLKGLDQVLDLIKDDEVREPESLIEGPETVVGEMTDIQKKLYTYMCDLGEQCDRFFKSRSVGEIMTMLKEKNVSEPPYFAWKRIVQELLWEDINSHFDLRDKDHLGVRKGFKVVVWDKERNTR